MRGTRADAVDIDIHTPPAASPTSATLVLARAGAHRAGGAVMGILGIVASVGSAAVILIIDELFLLSGPSPAGRLAAAVVGVGGVAVACWHIRRSQVTAALEVRSGALTVRFPGMRDGWRVARADVAAVDVGGQVEIERTFFYPLASLARPNVTILFTRDLQRPSPGGRHVLPSNWLWAPVRHAAGLHLRLRDPGRATEVLAAHGYPVRPITAADLSSRGLDGSWPIPPQAVAFAVLAALAFVGRLLLG